MKVMLSSSLFTPGVTKLMKTNLVLNLNWIGTHLVKCCKVFKALSHFTSTMQVYTIAANAGADSSSQLREEANRGGNRPMLRPDSSAWSVQTGTEMNAEMIKLDIKSKGGVGALKSVFDLRQELVSTEDLRKVVDANGDELPISVQEAVRCRSIVDEVGLLRIINSEWKVKVSKATFCTAFGVNWYTPLLRCNHGRIIEKSPFRSRFRVLFRGRINQRYA